MMNPYCGRSEAVRELLRGVYSYSFGRAGIDAGPYGALFGGHAGVCSAVCGYWRRGRHRGRPLRLEQTFMGLRGRRKRAAVSPLRHCGMAMTV